MSTSAELPVSSVDGGDDRPSKLAAGLSFFSVLFAVLLQAIDYGLVFPSLYLYLLDLSDGRAPSYMLGITIGIFGLFGMLTSLFVGAWLDRRPMKEVLVMLHILSFTGMTVYAFSNSVAMAVIGRAICGCGTAIFAASNLYVVRMTQKEERTAMFAKVNLVLGIGLIAGPGLNAPLALIHGRFRLQFVRFDHLSAPGWVMMGLFLISLAFIFAFFIEPAKSEEEKAAATMNRSWKEDAKILFALAPASLLLAQFIALFNQTTLESILTVVTKEYWEFGVLQNSLYYGAATVLMIIFLIIIGALSGRGVSDRTLLLVGWILAGCGAGIIFAFSLQKDGIEFWQFACGSAVFVASIPFVQSIAPSLLSKLLVDDAIQGRGQSLVAIAGQLAAVIGPTISGVVLDHGLTSLFGMILGVWIVGIIVYLVSYRHLLPPAEPEVVPEPDESDALLGGEQSKPATPRRRSRANTNDGVHYVSTSSGTAHIHQVSPYKAFFSDVEDFEEERDGEEQQHSDEDRQNRDNVPLIESDYSYDSALSDREDKIVTPIKRLDPF